MLTDDQLFHLSNAMDFKLEKVCFKDELPKVLKFNTAYIINLDNSIDEKGEENEGTHWTCLQVNKYPTGLIEPIFFDPYGQPPAEAIKKFVTSNIHKDLPYTDKDIQSLMNNACGWYCCAFLHYINVFPHRTKNLYIDTAHFLDLFEDLNVSANYKKNEYILKHFFQSKDPVKRKEIDVFTDTNSIMGEDSTGTKIMAEMKSI
jgi:hypothetical protein